MRHFVNIPIIHSLDLHRGGSYSSRIVATVASKLAAKDTGADAAEAAGFRGAVSWGVLRGDCLFVLLFPLHSSFV